MTRALIILTLLGSLAHAQTPELLALGKKEFEAGRAEFDLGHYDEALQHFEASYRLTDKPALLFNIGYVHRRLFDRTRRLDQLELAIERFRTFLKRTAQEVDATVVAQRGRVERDLKDAEDTLATEQAARARGEETLRVGEELTRKGRIDEARAQLDRFVRTTDPPNERPGLVRAELLRAALAIVSQDPTAAENAYARALTLDHGATPPVNPISAEVFARARARVGNLPPLSVTHLPPGAARVGQPITIGFQVASDPMKMIAGVVLHYRAGSGAFSTVPRAEAGPIALPREFTQGLSSGATVEYYADVVDEAGAMLEHLGSASLPFSLRVGSARGPVTKKWWFWVATAGAVAVAATAIGLGVGLSQPQPAKEIPIGGFGAALLHW